VHAGTRHRVGQVSGERDWCESAAECRTDS
jgi:hypothetical protein